MNQRGTFSKNIKEVEHDLLLMGDAVISAIKDSIETLKNRDIKKANKIIKNDEEINKKRWAIEESCICLIATQQPVATELRELISILNIITELERIGDLAEGIAKVVVLLGNKPPLKPLIDIPRMAEKAVEMLRKSLKAFVDRDAKGARAICDEDDEIDMLYDQVFRELLTYMIEDPKTISRATYLIWVAHNLERTADRVTNICERIIFLVTGKMEEFYVSKY